MTVFVSEQFSSVEFKNKERKLFLK